MGVELTDDDGGLLERESLYSPAKDQALFISTASKPATYIFITVLLAFFKATFIQPVFLKTTFSTTRQLYQLQTPAQ